MEGQLRGRRRPRRTKPPSAAHGTRGLHSLAELGDPLFESTRRCFRRIGSVSPACGDSDPLGPCSFRFPGRFAPKLRGASAAASDLATVSLRPNSLASNLESGVPLCEPMATVSVGTIHHLSPILMRRRAASMPSLPVREKGGHGRRETSMTVVSAMTKTRSCGDGETSAPPVNSPKEGRTAPCAPNQKHGSRCR